MKSRVPTSCPCVTHPSFGHPNTFAFAMRSCTESSEEEEPACKRSILSNASIPRTRLGSRYRRTRRPRDGLWRVATDYLSGFACSLKARSTSGRCRVAVRSARICRWRRTVGTLPRWSEERSVRRPRASFGEEVGENRFNARADRGLLPIHSHVQVDRSRPRPRRAFLWHRSQEL